MNRLWRLAPRTIVPARNERGASSIAQTVIVAPTVLLALMLIVQFGLYFHARNLVENAAQAGAAVGRSYDGTEEQARSQADAYLEEAGGTLVDHRVTASRTLDSTEVTVQATVAALVPGLDLTVTETAAGPVERYVPPTDDKSPS